MDSEHSQRRTESPEYSELSPFRKWTSLVMAGIGLIVLGYALLDNFAETFQFSLASLWTSTEPVAAAERPVENKIAYIGPRGEVRLYDPETDDHISISEGNLRWGMSSPPIIPPACR